MQLFNLPFVVFRNVIQLMGPIEIIFLSFCSKRSKAKVEKIKFPTIEQYIIANSEKKHMFFFTLQNQEKRFGAVFNNKLEGELLQLKKFVHPIKGLSHTIRYNDFNLFIGEKMKTSDMFNCIGYFLDLFRIKIRAFVIHSNGTCNVREFSSQSCIQQVAYVFLRGTQVSSIGLYSLFYKLKGPLVKAHVYPRVEGSVDMLPKLFSADDVLITRSDWVTREHFLSSDCKKLVLKFSKLETDSVISFVKNWLNGSYNRLQHLIVYGDKRDAFDKEKIINEFKTKPWDPTRRAQRFISNATLTEEDPPARYSSDCGDGYDLERGDGLLATIKIPECQATFFFLVWHDRFPTIS